MERSIRRIRRKDEDLENLRYWQTKSPEERLSALQEIREQYIKLFRKENAYRKARKGLRRVYRVVKLSQS